MNASASRQEQAYDFVVAAKSALTITLMPPFPSCDYNSIIERKPATHHRSFSSDMNTIQRVHKFMARLSSLRRFVTECWRHEWDTKWKKYHSRLSTCGLVKFSKNPIRSVQASSFFQLFCYLSEKSKVKTVRDPSPLTICAVWQIKVA
jgi:hypothetical protein